MVTYRDLTSGFQALEIDSGKPVIVHASLSSFGRVRGGAETLVGALLSVFHAVMVPTFTYKTMIVPDVGPPNNGIVYGSRKDSNLMAEFFHIDMPADPLMGIVPETLRKQPQARRSPHPILSFAGVEVADALAAQTIGEPLAPIRHLIELDGWVLLLGVNHRANTSIHYAELASGRKQFIRWALTPTGVVECPHFPCCSGGFNQLAPHLTHITRLVEVGSAQIQALPLPQMISEVQALIQEDPTALLCDKSDCERCDAIRKDLPLNRL